MQRFRWDNAANTGTQVDHIQIRLINSIILIRLINSINYVAYF